MQTFETTQFATVVELRSAADPLRASITRTNEAFEKLARERLKLTMEMLLQAPASTATHHFICRLRHAEAYQWHHVRPSLNAALVNVLIAWRHDGDELLLQQIRKDQQRQWNELETILRFGAQQL